jgi:hypothetical protein
MKKIDIDKNDFIYFIKIGCSNRELADVFSCSERAIANRKVEWGLKGLTPNNKTTNIKNGKRACIRCNEIKSVENFSKNSSKQGLSSVCKLCASSESKSRYNSNLEYEYKRRKIYYENNKEKFMEKYHKRRASKLNATPAWYSELDVFALEEAYDLCRIREEETGVKHHIDHIIPLQGVDVCGLHYHKNWQVIPAKDNLSKGNKLLEKYKNG